MYLNGKLNKISFKILASSTRYLVKMILPFCHHCLQHAVIVTIKWHHWVVEFVFQSSITSYTLKHISYTIIFTKWLLHVLIHDFRLSHVLQLSMNDIYIYIYITICIKSLYIIYLFFYCNLNEMTTHSSSFNGVPHVLYPLSHLTLLNCTWY